MAALTRRASNPLAQLLHVQPLGARKAAKVAVASSVPARQVLQLFLVWLTVLTPVL